MNLIGEGIQAFWIVLAEEDGKIPLKAVTHSLSSMPHWIIRPNINSTYGVFCMIHTCQEAVITSSIYNFVVGWVNCYMSRFSSSRRFPIRFVYITTRTTVLYSNGGVVLLSYIYSIRKSIVRSYPIELCGRLVVIRTPGSSTVIGNLSSAVIRYYHTLIVFWSNP